MMTRSGYFKNNLSGTMAYKSFTPSDLPPNPEIQIDSEMINLLLKANREVALLDSISTKIPNMELFISIYVRKEALMSSQIEGTQATLEDILNPKLESNANRSTKEVVNYTKAMYFAIDRLKELPICNRMLKETHKILLAEGRGENKFPGEFRKTQNWIGGAGSSLVSARYIPPSVEDMKQAMSNLEKYINTDDNTDALIKAALIHYQFESIHPFLDGNGRIGRLLIVIFLIQQKVLSVPSLYISYFLKQNRIEYYDRMDQVRHNGDYEQWIKFFLEAVYMSAKDAKDTIGRLTDLRDKNYEKIKGFGKGSKNAMALFNYLESKPIIDIKKTADDLNIAFNTISSAIDRLIQIEILYQVKEQSRNRTFVYKEYLEILKEGT